MKKEIIGVIELQSEDHGVALVAEAIDDTEGEIWVRLGSWSPTKTHTDIKNLEGKKVKITIETL